MTNFQSSTPEPNPSMTSIPLGEYVAVAEESNLQFKAKAFALFWVRGHMPARSGTLRVADGRLSGTGEIAADRLTTGVGARDWHLRSSHYLHTKRHPTITLSVQDAEVASGQADCTITVRDVSRVVPMTLESVEFRDGQLHLEADVDLDRTVFPMLPPAAGVSRIVHVALTVVARPA